MIFNDLYCLKVNEESNQEGETVFYADWKMIEPNTKNDPKRPCARTSHSCTVYKNRYLIIVGGETELDSNSNSQLS